MVLVLLCLFFVFGQYRTGAANGYSAEFTDVSRLEAGDSVRVVGIRVGTVEQRVAAAGQNGRGDVRRRPQRHSHRRQQGRGSLPQPGGRPLSGSDRRARIDKGAAAGVTDRSTTPRRPSTWTCCCEGSNRSRKA